MVAIGSIFSKKNRYKFVFCMEAIVNTWILKWRIHKLRVPRKMLLKVLSALLCGMCIIIDRTSKGYHFNFLKRKSGLGGKPSDGKDKEFQGMDLTKENEKGTLLQSFNNQAKYG